MKVKPTEEAVNEAIKAIDKRRWLPGAPMSARVLLRRPSAWAAVVAISSALPQDWHWARLTTVLAGLFIVFWQARVRR